MEKLYRIEELTTEGWTLLDDKAVQLTKSQCDVMLDIKDHYKDDDDK